jgi:hypothetical protein
MTPAIAPSILRRSTAIRKSFHSNDPLPRFTVIENFLRPGILRDAVRGCQKGRYSTFCAYSSTQEMREVHEEFREPDEASIYLSVHERMRSQIPLDCLCEAFEEKATIDALSELTGIPLSRSSGGLLTSWQPGSFLERHTDHAPGSKEKLAVSLSLTGRWHPSYGGMTVFAWGGVPRRVLVPPRRNTAVLFAPYSRSYHWVEQIAAQAPPRRRFTWTVHFS